MVLVWAVFGLLLALLGSFVWIMMRGLIAGGRASGWKVAPLPNNVVTWLRGNQGVDRN